MPPPLAPAALHVAAATGRADVVRQLAASGAAIDKPLPMDYRALVRQQLAADAAAGAISGSGSGAASSDSSSTPPVAPDDCEAAQAAAAAGGLGVEGPWDEAGDGGGGGVPPPKRGRYVTAGPADPGPPSLQYCTALHLAALQGQLEVARVLLGTGQVRAARAAGWGGLQRWLGYAVVKEGAWSACAATTSAKP